jgi:cation transport protein ChaC
MDQGAGDLWVFGYGSLMWNPGFEFTEAHPALLRGYHRAMCVLSNHYRGSPAHPGLVLGLDRGGACRGRAFRVPAEEAVEVKKYLHDREMITGVYIPRFLPVLLPDGSRVPGYAFIVDREHPQYVSPPMEQAARMIRLGCGCNGSCREYLANTVRHLDDMGIRDGELHDLLRLVDAGCP